jgi:two-component system sensor histidine kinase TctE
LSAPGYSLRRRLLLGLFVALAAIGLLALFDTWREAVNTSNTVSDRVLAGSVLAIAERVIVTEDGALEVDVPYVALEMLTSAAQDRVFYRVDGPEGFITGYQTLPTATAGGELRFFDARFRGEPIRVALLQRAASSGVQAIPFTVTVAETTIARSQLAGQLLLRAALRLGILIVAAAVILWFAVSLALRPLVRLGAAIGRRSPSDLEPITEEVPREVSYLVSTVNSFMARLEVAIAALRHFTGNASHQLRTPLAIVRTQIALAARSETPTESRQALATADDAVVHAERILAQMLVLARIDEAASDRLKATPVDLGAIAGAETAEHVRAARAAGIDLGFEAEGAFFVHGDAMLLREMVRNLVENAIAYAGAGAEATVRLGREGESVVLVVEDTGPGVAPDRLDTLRQRFRRGDDGKPGAGLGLPIVEEIATLFDGRLDVASSPGQGFRVTVRLPATAAHLAVGLDGATKPDIQI